MWVSLTLALLKVKESEIQKAWRSYPTREWQNRHSDTEPYDPAWFGLPGLQEVSDRLITPALKRQLGR